MSHSLPKITSSTVQITLMTDSRLMKCSARTRPIGSVIKRSSPSLFVWTTRARPCDIAISEPIHQSFQRRSLDALSCVNAFDLCDPTFVLASSVNCVNAESAIADEPRYELLSH